MKQLSATPRTGRRSVRVQHRLLTAVQRDLECDRYASGNGPADYGDGRIEPGRYCHRDRCGCRNPIKIDREADHQLRSWNTVYAAGPTGPGGRPMN